MVMSIDGRVPTSMAFSGQSKTLANHAGRVERRSWPSVRSRKSVTLAAQSMQTAALISYRRGTIQVLDRAGLEEASCECCAIVKARFDAFLTPPPTAVPGHNKSRSDQTEKD
jgi:hypothetical protein